MFSRAMYGFLLPAFETYGIGIVFSGTTLRSVPCFPNDLTNAEDLALSGGGVLPSKQVIGIDMWLVIGLTEAIESCFPYNLGEGYCF
jgi:hypothetical protein